MQIFSRESIKIRRNLESNTLLDEKLQKQARKSGPDGRIVLRLNIEKMNFFLISLLQNLEVTEKNSYLCSVKGETK